MKYRMANVLGIVIIIVGLMMFGVSVSVFQTESNVVAILAIAIISIGFVIRFLFYRCPKCGAMLQWRTLNIKYCQNCGNRL